MAFEVLRARVEVKEASVDLRQLAPWRVLLQDSRRVALDPASHSARISPSVQTTSAALKRLTVSISRKNFETCFGRLDSLSS